MSNENLTPLFKEPNNFLIWGMKGSAKTALGMSFLKMNSEVSGRKAIVFRHPKPQLLLNLPFKVRNTHSMKELYNLTDCVVLIDEAHRHFNVLSKSVNEDLKEILSNSRQNNTSFIFICHNTYFITRGLFTYIDVRVIKEVTEGHWEIERPHIKKMYHNTNIVGKGNFFIDSDYYRGKESFTKPDWYNDDLSVAYRNEEPQEKQDFFSKVMRKMRVSATSTEEPRLNATKEETSLITEEVLDHKRRVDELLQKTERGTKNKPLSILRIEEVKE